MKRWALLLVLAITTSALATTVVRRSIEDMARESALIVHGRAGKSWTRWDGGLLRTYTRIHVERALKGSPAESVVVKQLGGTTAAYSQKVSGVRHWVEGQEVVLFLKPAQRGDAYVVTGLMQGNFVVRQERGRKVLSNGMPGVAEHETRSGETGAYRGTDLTLEQLEQRVRKAVTP